MMSSEMERLRNDLDVIQQAIGGRLPLAWKDAGLNLILAAAGALTAALARVVPAEMIRWSVVPIVLAAIPMMGATRKASTEDSIQAARRREYRLGWMVIVVLVAVAVPYLFWERRLGASARMSAGGACVLLSGVACAVFAMTSPARRYYWGHGLPLIVWGFLVPGESLRQIAIGGGIMCIFAGLFGAVILAWQLRRQERA